MINTVDKYGNKRTIALKVYESLPINKDGSRGQNGLQPETPIAVIDTVSNEIADFIASKRKIEVKVDEVTGEPIEKKSVAKTNVKKGKK